MTNTADPDQLASEISRLLQKPTDLDLQFAKTGHAVFSKRSVIDKLQAHKTGHASGP